jgi:sugar phosphate permease
MWSIAVTFFAFQFVLRLFPGLVMPEIMEKFKIGATSFGILSAAYYLGYAGMQIPVGILLDRYSPKFVISGCAFLCGMGTLSFVYSETWYLTLFGRFLIGAGSAGGFLGTAKTIRMNFPERRFTSMIGISFTIGLLGAIYGGKPVGLLMAQIGWTAVLKILAGVSLVLAAATLVLFPSPVPLSANELQKKREHTARSLNIQAPILTIFGSFREAIHEMIKNPKILWIGVAGALLVGPLEGFADIWGVSYLVNVHAFSTTDASLIASSIYFGMLFGGPILSFLSQKLNAHYPITAACALIMAVIFSGILVSDATFSKPLLMFLMSIVGVLCCYQVIVFSLVCELVPSHLSGLVTSTTNCFNMVAGCVLHFFMGWIMDRQWSGDYENGLRVYGPASYTSAIAIIPITLLFGFMAFLILKSLSPKKLNSSNDMN